MLRSNSASLGPHHGAARPQAAAVYQPADHRVGPEHLLAARVLFVALAALAAGGPLLDAAVARAERFVAASPAALDPSSSALMIAASAPTGRWRVGLSANAESRVAPQSRKPTIGSGITRQEDRSS